MMVILVIRIATLDSLQGKTLVTKVIKEILVTEEFPHLKLAAHPFNKGNAGNVGNIGNAHQSNLIHCMAKTGNQGNLGNRGISLSKTICSFW